MDILSGLKSLVDATQLQVLFYLVLANVLTGLVGALVKGNFEVVKLVGFWKRLAVVVGAYLVAGLAAKGLSDFEPLRTAVWAALIAYLSGHIIANLKEWGLPLPDGFVKFFEKK